MIQISDDNPTGKAESHFRNVKTINWSDTSKAKALANLGGGPRPQPKTEKGVPIYFHDWYGTGRHAMVVSSRSPEFKADPSRFHSESPLTGDESRVAEASNVEFPRLLDPVDDLPPATVITQTKRSDGKLTVRGSTSDNGTVKRVLVNGKEATALTPNFAEWEIVLDVGSGPVKIEAGAEDAAGNVEKTPMTLIVK